MNTYLSCIPCFFNQVIHSGKLIGLDQKELKIIMDALGDELKRFSLDNSPPKMAELMQRLFTELSGNPDPYKMVKQESNAQALLSIDNMRAIVESSPYPLLSAVELSCAGNIIDFGAFPSGVDVEQEISLIMEEQKKSRKRKERSHFELDSFEQALVNAKRILYVGDNAGEIVFDRILIEYIRTLYGEKKDIYFATRGMPILNDVLIEDALAVGMDKVATIISSGVGSPGLIIEDAHDEFREIFYTSDLIISKGQGNYEALSQTSGPIFFLLMVKCAIIQEDIGATLRELVLIKHKRYSHA